MEEGIILNAFFSLGFVFVTNADEQTDGFKDASVAIFRAHNYIKLKSNAAKALSFITDVRYFQNFSFRLNSIYFLVVCQSTS